MSWNSEWDSSKLKLAMRQGGGRPPRLGVPKAELNRFKWKEEAEEEIMQLAPHGWKAQPVASWPVSLVIAELPDDGYWMDESNRMLFVKRCVDKANELYKRD